jgi:hypothetical protein
MPVDSVTENEAPQPAGIVERLVRDDSDRKRFLKMAGSAGAASFGAFVLAACGSSSSSSSSSSTAAPAATTSSSSANTTDIGILNYALTLEYLETEFYAKVVAAKLFSGSVGSLIKTFGAQEASHVAALTAAIKSLGGTPVAKVEGKTVLAAALAIHSVEARHASTLGTLVKKSLTPDGAFAKPADMSEVLAAVKPFLA